MADKKTTESNKYYIYVLHGFHTLFFVGFMFTSITITKIKNWDKDDFLKSVFYMGMFLASLFAVYMIYGFYCIFLFETTNRKVFYTGMMSLPKIILYPLLLFYVILFILYMAVFGKYIAADKYEDPAGDSSEEIYETFSTGHQIAFFIFASMGLAACGIIMRERWNELGVDFTIEMKGERSFKDLFGENEAVAKFMQDISKDYRLAETNITYLVNLYRTIESTGIAQLSTEYDNAADADKKSVLDNKIRPKLTELPKELSKRIETTVDEFKKGYKNFVETGQKQSQKDVVKKFNDLKGKLDSQKVIVYDRMSTMQTEIDLIQKYLDIIEAEDKKKKQAPGQPQAPQAPGQPPGAPQAPGQPPAPAPQAPGQPQAPAPQAPGQPQQQAQAPPQPPIPPPRRRKSPAPRRRKSPAPEHKDSKDRDRVFERVAELDKPEHSPPRVVHAKEAFLGKIKILNIPEIKTYENYKHSLRMFNEMEPEVPDDVDKTELVEDMKLIASSENIYQLDIIDKFLKKFKLKHNMDNVLVGKKQQIINSMEPILNFVKSDDCFFSTVGNENKIPDKNIYLQLFPDDGELANFYGQLKTSLLRNVSVTDNMFPRYEEIYDVQVLKIIRTISKNFGDHYLMDFISGHIEWLEGGITLDVFEGFQQINCGSDDMREGKSCFSRSKLIECFYNCDDRSQKRIFPRDMNINYVLERIRKKKN